MSKYVKIMHNQLWNKIFVISIKYAAKNNIKKKSLAWNDFKNFIADFFLFSININASLRE